MKMNIRCEEIIDDWINEEEETDEIEGICIKQVWEIFQNIDKEVKEIKSKP